MVVDKQERITREEALKHADSANNLSLRISLGSEIQDDEQSNLHIQVERDDRDRN